MAGALESGSAEVEDTVTPRLGVGGVANGAGNAVAHDLERHSNCALGQLTAFVVGVDELEGVESGVKEWVGE